MPAEEAAVNRAQHIVNRTVQSLIGPQLQCARCRSWWPLDDEFYAKWRNGQWRGTCRACLAEQRRTDSAEHHAKRRRGH